MSGKEFGPTFYEVLGLNRNATSAQVRGAYRALVMKHHPDQAGEQADVDAFIRVKEAYEVLSDPDRRKEYDRLLDLRMERQARSSEPPPNPAPAKAPRSASWRRDGAVVAELDRMTRLYGRGAFADAERAARAILEKDSRQATPYAILGDLARNRGDLAESARLYAFAIQMDPRNLMYQRKHDELMARIRLAETRAQAPRQRPVGMAPAVAFALIPVACAYVALSQEPAVLSPLAAVSTWTAGLLAMLFLSGVSLGVGMSLAQFVDRFEALSSNAVNRVSPALALASIAVVNFWAAALLYGLIGFRNRSQSYSTSRMVAGVGAIVALMGLAAAGTERIEPSQVLLWGGNLIYVGAVCGWMVADSLQE